MSRGQRGHIRQRAQRSDSYTLEWYISDPATGKPRKRSKTVRGGIRDARAELRKILQEVDTGAYVDPSRITLADFLEKWLAHTQTTVSPRTQVGYEMIANTHIIPNKLGRMRLVAIQPLHLQEYYAEALKSGRVKDGKGLSARTVHHHHVLLHKALGDAVMWKMLSFNPADSVSPPRVPRSEMKVLGKEQIIQILNGLRGKEIYLPVLLAIATGLRRGELLALRWEDIDLNSGALQVRRTLEETPRGLAFKEPKTEKSRRLIVLPKITIAALREHQKGKTSGLVYCKEDGSPVGPSNFTHRYIWAIEHNNLPRVRLHDLRHTQATLLFAAGVHPKVVQERLGHSTIAITLDTYSHVIPTMQEDAAKRVDDFLSMPE